jgi:4-hydroxybutyrate CoA-transferase
MTADQAASLVESGDSIYGGGLLAMPVEFTEALAKRKDELTDVQYFGALSAFPFKIFNGDFKGHIDYFTIFSGPFERHKVPEGNIHQLSVHLAEVDRALQERAKPNVLAVNVSSPDKHGWMTFGACGGFGQDTARNMADKLIVTVQPTMPTVHGEYNMIHVSEVDAIVETEIPLLQLPPGPPSTDLELQIASHVLPLIEDGSVIQVGIGGVPGAVARGLVSKKDLGIHSEMLSDDMYYLIEQGVVTGARKNIMEGKVVFAFAAGGADLMSYIDDNPSCVILPLSRTINAHECGLNDNFVSINTCLMVSVTGQVAAEAVNWVQISGTGGQLDLVRAARNSKNGKSFIVLPSTRTLKSGERISNITLGLPPGTPVTTPRTDVDYIATEYGCVKLRYKSNRERVEAMLSIAHPDFRDELTAGLEAQGLHL